MPFSVEDFQDLIRLLQGRPEWRADLRRLVLTEKLLVLPELVRELVQAQLRTEAQVGQPAESLESLRAETERRFQELATAQLILTRRIDDLREAVQTLGDRTYSLTTDVGELKGSDLERRHRERPFAYFHRLIRQAHNRSGDELNAMLDRAVAAQHLTEEDVDEIVWADAVVRGRRRQDGQEVYLVVEVSWGVGPYDMQQADGRAKLLAQAGVTTLPVVAGMWVTSDGEAAARAIKVWRVTNGRVVAPEQS